MITYKARRVKIVNGRRVGYLWWVEKREPNPIHFVEFFDLDTKHPLAEGRGSTREIAEARAVKNLG